MDFTSIWSQYWRPLLFLSFFGYLIYNRPEVTIPDSKVDRVKVASTARQTDRRVEITAPDGTKTVETVVEKETTQADEKSTESSVMSPPRTKYRAGVKYLPSLTDAPSTSDVAVSAGARVADSNVWVEVEVDVKHRQGSVGISVEW